MASSIRIRSNNGELAPPPTVSATSATWPLPPTAAQAAAAEADIPPTWGAGGPEEHRPPPAATGVEQMTEAGESSEPGISEPGGSYDFLFGATQRPPVHPDEVGAPPDPVPTSSDPGLTAGWSTTAPPALVDDGPAVDATADPPDDPTATEAGSRVIDAVPWLVSKVADRAGPAQPAAGKNDRTRVPEPGLTVDRSALLAEADPTPVGTTVLAGYCPAGHLSPPYAATCRVCRAPMPPDQPGFEMVRPALGVIRLADGGSVTLDRGVLFGRAPETSAEADERPHLVRLVSPENDVSRNHAQIVIDGWHVYVQDLGSTNGTVVTLPGRGPVRLRPDDLQLLEPGSTITLADEITVTFEVAG